MTAFLSFAELLLSFASGWLVIALALRPSLKFVAQSNDIAGRAQFCLQSCLAVAVALGWCSGFSFLNFAGVPSTITLLLQVALSVLLAFFYTRRQTQKGRIEYSIDRSTSTNGGRIDVVETKPRWLLPSFALLGGIAALMLLVVTLQQPHGSWDAWAIWNSHARFFFRGGMDWTAYLSPAIAWTHADYPLLLPLSIERGWSIAGRETTIVPAALAFFFTLGTGALLASAIWLLRGAVQAFAASLLLLSNAALVFNGAGQCADVPLGFFFLATAVCFALHDKAKNLEQISATGFSTQHSAQLEESATSRAAKSQGASFRGAIVVAGLMAGAAAWTKNEGLLFVVVVVTVRLLIAGRLANARLAASQLAAFIGGALPFIIVIALFKYFFAPPSDLAGGQDASILSRIGDPARYTMIFAALLRELLDFWSYAPMVVLLPYAGLMGLRRGVFRRPIAIEYSTVAGLVALMLMGYFFIYLLTPRDLAWHLKTSLGRLLLQLWPMLVFAFFLMVRTPQEALAAASNQEEQNAKLPAAHREL